MSEHQTGKAKWEPSRKEIALTSVLGSFFIGQIVLCVLFYNWANLDALLYLGWATFGVSFFIIGGMARYAFQTRGGKAVRQSWLETTTLVDTGIYAVVRHPIYLSFMIYPVGLMLISQHWLSPILGFPLIVYLYHIMQVEERVNMDKFGDDYRHYMARVPRANFVAGFIRLLRR
ncbi:MAG TPA: isoprenylcysteine carboxylmethyltransferase family protein [Dehalococcoidia bacterium]|nr:isoprenylcysteine carboxylmethyltransferase family protein [Dehalococcoidia bacterium]